MDKCYRSTYKGGKNNEKDKPSFFIKNSSSVISIGGKTKLCAFINPTTGLLSYLEYDKSCAIDTVLERDFGTLHLMKTLIEFVKQFHKSITHIILKDTASFKCLTDNSRGTKTTVRLTPYFLAIYGKSFYEKKYDAELIDSSLYHEYNMVKNKLQSPE